MKPGDIYYRPPYNDLVGVVTRPEEIIKKEFASYRIVYYIIRTDPLTKEWCDVFQLSEGPDVYLGWVQNWANGSYSCIISSDCWHEPPGKTLKEWLDNLLPDEVLEFFASGFITKSELLLEEQFEQAFQVG